MGYSYDSYEAYGYYYSLIILVEKIMRHVNEIITGKGSEREERERERENDGCSCTSLRVYGSKELRKFSFETRYENFSQVDKRTFCNNSFKGLDAFVVRIG